MTPQPSNSKITLPPFFQQFHQFSFYLASTKTWTPTYINQIDPQPINRQKQTYQPKNTTSLHLWYFYILHTLKKKARIIRKNNP